MARQRRPLVPTALILPLLAALVFATAAAAEDRVGQATSPADEAIPGYVDILSGGASYDSTAGTVTFTVTTREPLGSPTPLVLASLGTVEPPCEAKLITHPSVGITAEIGLLTFWEATDPEGEQFGQATSSVSGATATLTAAGSALAGRPYNCAAIIVAGESARDELEFPVVPSPPSPPSPASSPSVSVAAPVPIMPPAAPAGLLIAKSVALRLKAEEWKRAQIVVSDPGGIATTTGSLRVKAPKGVALKPASGRLRLPPLQPGQMKTLSFKVKLTNAAEAKSTLSLTATAGALTANSSVVAKLLN